MTASTVAKRRRYYGKANSSKCLRGQKTVGLFLDPPNVSRLIEALQKYENEAFQDIQSGVELEVVPPVEITIFDAKKTSEGIFTVTVTRKP